MYLSIRHRLSLPVLAGIMIVFVIIGFIYQRQVRQNIQAETSSTLGYRTRLVQAGLTAALETARGLALSASENTTIATALAGGFRDGLLDSTYPLLVNAGRELGLTRFEFYIPPATSFLKVQSPADFGRDLSLDRPELKTVISKGKALAGLTRSGTELVLRALEPIIQEGKTVGAVEFGVLVDKNLLKRYVDTKPAFNISILMNDEKEGFVFAARNHNLPILKTSFKALNQVLTTGRPQTLEAVKGGGRKNILISPLKGLNGANVALVAIPMDITGSDEALNRSLWILVALGMGSFLIIIALIYWSSGLLLFHLGRLTKIMSQVSQTHDLTQRIDIKLDRTCWQELNCGWDDCVCFKNPEALECWACAGSYSPVPTCPKLTEGQIKSCDSCSYFKKSLSNEIEVAGSIFNHLLATFSRLVTDSQRHARRVAKIADAISSGAGALNDQTQSQAAAVQEIAAGMEEMSASVGANVEGAKKAEIAGGQGHEFAQKGAEAVDLAMAATRSVTARSKDITAIVNSVKEIAFRTNLLALNASVEAARAGEAGRGFAVVAGEVRSLAQQAQESAGQIKKLLLELVEGIHESDKRILEAGEALAVIVKGAAASANQSAAISMSSQEQGRAIDNLSQVSVEIDRAAQGNAALVEQASHVAANLARSAHLVMETVGLFITEDKSSGKNDKKESSGPLLIGPDGVDSGGRQR